MTKFVEQNTKRPNIKSMVVSLILNHFWSHIFKCSTKSISHLTIVSLYTPSKITNFDNISLFDENVLRFNISMNETLFMHKVDTRTDLNEEVKRCIFTEVLLFSNQVEKITFGSKFKSKIYGFFILKTCIKSTNVFMI